MHHLIYSALFFIKKSNTEYRKQLKNVFDLVFKQVWAIKEDVRNFQESYNQLMKVLLSTEILASDSDDLFKNMVSNVISYFSSKITQI